MKTILVATDFSAASNNALKYALAFAKAFKSRLIVYHGFRIIYTTDVLMSPQQVKEDCREELQKQILACNQITQVDVKIIVEESVSILHSIQNIAKANEAELIFMGMKNNGRAMRKLFASTAVDLAHVSTIPLVIVPEKAPLTLPVNILLANDIHADTDLEILNPISEITSHLNAQLFIVRVVKEDSQEAEEKTQFEKGISRLAALHPQYIFAHDQNVNHKLAELLNQCKADMVVMVPHQHGVFDRLINSSKTNYMLFHSHIPVMVLPDKKSIITITDNKKTAYEGRYYLIE